MPLQASNNSSRDEIIKGIRESDFFVLIVANKYGTINKAFTRSDAKSITWWEYDIAINASKPIIPIFKNGSIENDNDSNKELLLQRFKNILTTKHSPQYFDTDQELYQKALHSIIPAYRDKAIKESQLRSELTIESEKLKNEIQKLQLQLNSPHQGHHLTLGINALAQQRRNTGPTSLTDLMKINYLVSK